MEVKDLREKLRNHGKPVAAILFLGVLMATVIFLGSFSSDDKVDDQEKADRPDNLTKYQRNYVDCPKKYLDLCTDMSKLPTEKVVFKKAEDQKLYLELPKTNRSMVAKIEEEGKDGYLIRIEE